jgi:hypothetical protein
MATVVHEAFDDYSPIPNHFGVPFNEHAVHGFGF